MPGLQALQRLTGDRPGGVMRPEPAHASGGPEAFAQAPGATRSVTQEHQPDYCLSCQFM
jgi:hypothetical protein